jgi:hypothetical protein
VLANGTVLVDGKAATLEELDLALASTKQASGQVWYYREAARGEAPPVAKQVIDRVVAQRVPISLSSKPDFSDWVDAKGVSHPRNTPVASDRETDEYFTTVRRTASGKGEGEGLVIVKPDRTLMVLPRMAESPELKGMAETVARMVPAEKQRNIAAIAHTAFENGPQGAAGIAEVGNAIPFFGILVGLSYIGHAVWVFDGGGSTLLAGCREADMVIVDSAVRGSLPAGWDVKVAGVMRNANILVHNRANSSLGAIRKVGTDPRTFEFKD